jgi:hypothetical protein
MVHRAGSVGAAHCFEATGLHAACAPAGPAGLYPQVCIVETYLPSYYSTALVGLQARTRIQCERSAVAAPRNCRCCRPSPRQQVSTVHCTTGACVQVDTMVLESMLRAQLPAVLDHFNELKMGTAAYSWNPQAAMQSLSNGTTQRSGRESLLRTKPVLSRRRVAEWQGCRS